MIADYRASQIIIEIPKVDSEPWVHLVINKILLDTSGKVINEIPRFDRISTKLSDIALQSFTFIDPVLKSTNSVSGYGLAKAITSYVSEKLKEKYGTN